MFGALFRRSKPSGSGRIPDGRAVYAVGDIHGRLDLLDKLLERIERDAARLPAGTQRELILLGDYIDRGADSRGVVDRVLTDPLPGFATVRLKGNHEDALLSFIDGLSDGLDWLSYGGLKPFCPTACR